MDKRQKEILRRFYQSNDYLTAKELAIKQGVSSKTIRNDIKEINEYIDKFAKVLSWPSKGYKLEIYDEKIFVRIYNNIFSKENMYVEKLETQEGRVIRILDILLNSDKFIKIEELAEKLYISSSQINKDIQILKEKLDKYSLEIVSKPYYGIKVEGDERNRRRCYANVLGTGNYGYFSIKSLSKDSGKRVKKIKKIIRDVFDEYNFSVNHAMYQNFIVHIFIMLDRISTGNDLFLSDEVENVFQDKKIGDITNEICNRLENLEDIKISYDERVYTAYHIASQNYNEKNKYNSISNEVYDLIDKIFQEIYNTFHIDFSEDLDLKVSLGLHITPLIDRIKLKVLVKNPLIEEIKKDAIAYQVSSICAYVINKKFNTSLEEDEIAYLAAHFSLALLRKNSNLVKRNILIVSSTGIATSELMKYRLEKEFDKYINRIDYIDYTEFDKEKKTYDVIVTTKDLDIKIDTNLPIINVSPMLSKLDIENIRNKLLEEADKKEFDLLKFENFHPHYKAKNKKDFFSKMIVDLSKNNKLDENFLEEILKREELASTCFYNMVAIPHPLSPSSEETFVSVFILDKPIEWGESTAQIVILLSLGKSESRNMQSKYRIISSLILSRDRLENIVKEQSYENFLLNLFKGSIDE